MIVYITDQCNKNCSYCFINNKEKFPDISQIDFSLILDYLEHNKHNSLTIAGGEPTMHPGLHDLIRSASERNFKIAILSNGLFNPAVFKDVDLTGMVVGCHVPSAKEHASLTQHNIEYLKHKGAYVILRSVITDNYNFHPDQRFIIQNKQCIDEVRYKIALKNIDATNEYVTNVGNIKLRLLGFLTAVYKAGIRISSCCKVPYCEFTANEVDFLYKAGFKGTPYRTCFYIDNQFNVILCPFHNTPLFNLKTEKSQSFLPKDFSIEDIVSDYLDDKCRSCHYKCANCLADLFYRRTAEEQNLFLDRVRNKLLPQLVR